MRTMLHTTDSVPLSAFGPAHVPAHICKATKGPSIYRNQGPANRQSGRRIGRSLFLLFGKYILAFLFFVLGANGALAEIVNVAVAANFTDTAKEIARLFEENTGHEAILSFGSSGQFYAQIKQNAPFQVFLSADDERPKQLVADGLGVPGEEFTYAVGKLALWSPKPGFVTDGETLRKGQFSKIAIANPASAPYGVAAIEVMKSLHAYETLQPKIVLGSSVAQAFQFVKTDNAELGFVALAQIVNQKGGSWWLVPIKYYRPIRQNAVLLKTGASNPAARAFIAFLKGSVAKSVIEKFGYGTELIVSRAE